MFQRFAAASVLTMAVGGALIGAAPAMATTAHDGPKSVENHKGSDDDQFSNKADQTQYCLTLSVPVIVNTRMGNSPRIKSSCNQQLWQENEGDEPEIGQG
jgi:hypothetical protein